MKIGIIITPHFEEELKKEEFVSVNSQGRPWLKRVQKDHYFVRNAKPCVSGDIAIGYYIMYKYPHVKVDFIKPSEMSLKRLHANDLNFLVIYDRLESFHTQPLPLHRKFVDVLRKCKNIYPDFATQTLINYKATYYRYLQKQNITVVPFKDITHLQWTAAKSYPKKLTLVERVFKHAQRNNWKKICVKPYGGQESVGVEFFDLTTTNVERIYHYVDNGMRLYEGVIFQQFIPNFSEREFRTYFVGSEYAYTIISRPDVGKVRQPVSEGGDYNDTKRLKQVHDIAKKVVKVLPKIVVDGVELPRWLTRVDIGCCFGPAKALFVSEVEMVPSLYIKESPYYIEAPLGDQAVSITDQFVRQKAKRKK